MKCQKCNESFKIIGVDKEHIGTCPKCGEKIIPTPNAFESISEAIYYCIQIGSKEPFDILNNKTKLNSYLEDTLGSSYPERNMIKAAIDSDIGATLFRAKGSSDGARKEAFDEAVDQMQRSYGTEIGIARKTVEYFTDAMGWSIIPEQSTKTKETVHTNVPPSNKTPAKSAVTPASDNPPKTSQTPVTNNMHSSQPQSTRQRQQHNNNYPAQQPQKPAKKKGCLKLFLVLTLFLLAAIAFIFLKVFLFSDSIEDESSKDNTSFSQNNEINENENIVTTYEAEVTTEDASKSTESTRTTTKASTTEKNMTQTTTSAKAEETEKYTVRSLSSYVDFENKNNNKMFYSDNFDVDTENNILYYTLGDSIYTVDLDTGESELYMQVEAYKEIPGSNMYVIYNQYNHKMYCAVVHTSGSGITYLFDITSKEPTLILTVKHSGKRVFTSENIFCVVSDSTYGYGRGYEINMTDQSEKQGYVEVYWDSVYTNSVGIKESIYIPFNKLIPILKNDSYYWLEANNGETAICYTMKSICNDKENCGEFIGLFENTISQCVTENEAYIMTDNFSIYRIDVEKLLENYDYENPKADYSFALELIIDGKDIKQTGVNNISEPFGLRMTTDGRFVIFDSFDYTFKIVEKK